MQYTLLSALALAATVSAQVTFNSDNNTFICSSGATAFCAGDSLSTPIIIRCNGTQGQPGNCNDNLAGVDPVGVKAFAPCYQSSPTAGDAACSFNNVVYPDNGAPFNIPGSMNQSNSTSMNSTTITTSTSTTPASVVVITGTTTITSCSSNACSSSSSTSTGTATLTSTAGAASKAPASSTGATATSSRAATYTPGSDASVQSVSSGFLALGALFAMLF